MSLTEDGSPPTTSRRCSSLPTGASKAGSVIEEGAVHGARLIALPAASLPGFPVWVVLEAPIRTHELFKKLAASAALIDGSELARIRQTG